MTGNRKRQAMFGRMWKGVSVDNVKFELKMVVHGGERHAGLWVWIDRDMAGL